MSKHLTKQEYSELQREKAIKRFAKKEVDPKQEVIAAWSKGIGYEGITDIILMIDDTPCHKPEFYEAQNQMIAQIEQAAQDSCSRELDKIDAGGFSHDGQWSARRNAEHCMVEFISVETKKILGYSIGSLNPDVSDFEIPPGTKANQLEDLTTKHLWEELKSNDKTKKFSFRVHDRDVNSFAIFSVSDVDEVILQDYDDPNHSKKTFEEMLSNIDKLHPLGPLKESLIDRFEALANETSLTYEERIQQWEQTPEEIIKHHPNDCPLLYGWRQISKEEMMASINFAIETTKFFLEKCSKGSTNPNESFHSLKVRVAPKHVAYGRSYRARSALAVLMWNEPLQWYNIVCDYCDICPISEEHHQMLQQRLEAKRKHNDKEDELSEKMKKDKKRKEKRNQKPDPDGHNEAHNPQLSKPKDIHDIHRNIGIHMYGVFPSIGKADYASSVLQMLYNTEFSEFMKEISEYVDASAPLIQDLLFIFNILEREEIVEKSVFERFISYFGFNENTRINPGEFCYILLDEVHSNIAGNSRLQYKRQDFEALFGFVVERHIHCHDCHRLEIDRHMQFVINLFQTETTAPLSVRIEMLQNQEFNCLCPKCHKEVSHRMIIVHYPIHPIFDTGRFNLEGEVISGSTNQEILDIQPLQPVQYGISHIINFRGTSLQQSNSAGMRCFVKRNGGVIEFADARSYETSEKALPINEQTCLVLLSDINDICFQEHDHHEESNIEKEPEYIRFLEHHSESEHDLIIASIITFLIEHENPACRNEIKTYFRCYNNEADKMLLKKSQTYVQELMRSHPGIFSPFHCLKDIPGVDKRSTFYGLVGKEYNTTYFTPKKDH